MKMTKSFLYLRHQLRTEKGKTGGTKCINKYSMISSKANIQLDKQLEVISASTKLLYFKDTFSLEITWLMMKYSA